MLCNDREMFVALRGCRSTCNGGYASARLDDEPFSTSPTEGAVQWLLHRRMGARQQMRWSPRGAHLMLQARTAIVNGTFEADHGSIGRRCRSFHMAA
jgi:hypothetical protein